ncbi:MAG TPA: amidase, partial [Actinomycetaceae bacterium]|nr:amidase [Actinomycetaceae bacterium]
MTQIHELDATALAAAIGRRELSHAEVVEHTLERAERLGPRVGAFAHLTPDYARAQARAADEGTAGEAAGGPFFGVPCPIKDLTMVEGLPFEAGSVAMRGTVAPATDGVARLLARAGTTMIGKTTTPEFGLPPYTEPDTGPAARNPWDVRRSAGGSSGGAAAAVAAGIVPVAHASDGGGSIRIPASVCGLVGLKPSRGQVSHGPLRVDGAGLTTDGVLTRSVADAAAFLDVLSRPWPGDYFALASENFAAAAARPPGPLRIGILLDPINVASAPVHATSRAAVERATRVL